MDDEYQKIDQCILYYHKPSGYYYEAVSQQFLSPVYQYDNSTEVSSSNNTVNASVQSQTESQTETQTQSQSKTEPVTSLSGDIASTLAAVSDNAMQHYGFTYDESSGFYYDHKTGLYYDQANQLYYDSVNGTYYTYNTETQQYEIYCRVELPTNENENNDNDNGHVIQAEPMSLKSRVLKESKLYLELIQELESPEEGEIAPPKCLQGIPDSPPPLSEWPPCIRMVPQDQGLRDEAQGSKVKLDETDGRNCISVITAEGAQIGRDVSGPHTIRILDLQVSKQHCDITYIRRRESFIVTECGSQNGTFINGERISEPKQKSKPHLLQHGDILTIGSTPFLLHIHRGLASCPECSHIGSSTSSHSSSSSIIFSSGPTFNESLDLQRRKELNKIKKKYGLRTKDTYTEKLYELPNQYSDKSAERRIKVGSDLPEVAIRDDLPSSTHRPIAEENKGHQMLLKIGWQQGQGLGRHSTGIQQPVTSMIRDERAGLGFSQSSRDMDTGSNAGSENRQKMLKHYHEVVEREAKRKKRFA